MPPSQALLGGLSVGALPAHPFCVNNFEFASSHDSFALPPPLWLGAGDFATSPGPLSYLLRNNLASNNVIHAIYRVFVAPAVIRDNLKANQQIS